MVQDGIPIMPTHQVLILLFIFFLLLFIYPHSPSLAKAVMLARAFPMFKEVNGEADRFGVVVASEKRMKRIYGWVRSFNIRHNYAPRRPTHVAQNPNVQEREIDDFVSLVRRYAERYVIPFLWDEMCNYNHCIDRNKVPIRNILNADQTNWPYAPPPKATLAPRGSRSVNVAVPKTKCGTRLTLMVCAGADGTLLPLMGVFQGTPKGKVKREANELSRIDPKVARFVTQDNAWFDEDVMLTWINTVSTHWLYHMLLFHL